MPDESVRLYIDSKLESISAKVVDLNLDRASFAANHKWSIESLREYFDTNLASLKELKSHDLSSVHDLLALLNTRVNETFASNTLTTNYRFENLDKEITALKELKSHDFASVYKRIELLDARLDEIIASRDVAINERFNDSEKILLVTRDGLTVALQASREAVSVALQSAKDAVTKAELATEKRFDSVNEFRGSLSDLTRLMMPRSEAENMVRAQGDKIDSALARLDKTEGRTGASTSHLATMIAVAAVVVSLGMGVMTFAGRASPEASRFEVLNERLNALTKP